MMRLLSALILAIFIHLLVLGSFSLLKIKAPEPIRPKVNSVRVTMSYKKKVENKFVPPSHLFDPKNHQKKKEIPPVIIQKTKAEPPRPTPKKKKTQRPVKKTVSFKRALSDPKQKEMIKKELKKDLVEPAKNDDFSYEQIRIEQLTEQYRQQPLPPVPTPTPQKDTVKEPEYINNPLPPYPKKAKKRRQQGTVWLKALISKTGKALQVTVQKSSGYRSLDRQAVKSVNQWQFKPGEKNGLAVEMWVQIPITFQLN